MPPPGAKFAPLAPASWRWRAAALAITLACFAAAWAGRFDSRSRADRLQDALGERADDETPPLPAPDTARPPEETLAIVREGLRRIQDGALDERSRLALSGRLLGHLEGLEAQGDAGNRAKAEFYRGLVARDGFGDAQAAIGALHRFLTRHRAAIERDAALFRMGRNAEYARDALLDQLVERADPETFVERRPQAGESPGLALERKIRRARDDHPDDPDAEHDALLALASEYRSGPFASRLDLALARSALREGVARYDEARRRYGVLAKRVGIGADDVTLVTGADAASARAAGMIIPGEDPALLVGEIRYALARIEVLSLRARFAQGAVGVLIALLLLSAAHYPSRRPAPNFAARMAVVLGAWGVLAAATLLLFLGSADLSRVSPATTEMAPDSLAGIFAGVVEHDNNTLDARQVVSGLLWLLAPLVNLLFVAAGLRQRAESGRPARWAALRLVSISVGMSTAALVAFLSFNDAMMYLFL